MMFQEAMGAAVPTNDFRDARILRHDAYSGRKLNAFLGQQAFSAVKRLKGRHQEPANRQRLRICA